MSVLADLAQLQHVRQHGDGASLAAIGLLSLGQGLQRRLHGGRAGVISVVDKGNVANIDNLLATAGEARRGQGLGAGLHIHPIAGSACYGGKSVIHIVLADEL